MMASHERINLFQQRSITMNLMAGDTALIKMEQRIFFNYLYNSWIRLIVRSI